MVKSYLDLLTRNDELVYGGGLNALYVMSLGLDSYNDNDIIDATEKAKRLGMIPHGLKGFMITSILKNCLSYAKMMQEMINDRLVAIARGDIANPQSQIKWSAAEARRYYYLPPFVFLQRLQKALAEDYGSDDHRGIPIVNRIEDVAIDADLYLIQAQGNEGYSTPQQSSFRALTEAVDNLVQMIKSESDYPYDAQTYTRRAVPALKIIWFITKMLLGDLTVRPDRKDMEIVDLNKQLNISDGTLVSIPFPTMSTLRCFTYLEEGNGVTMKGRTYLAAASLAAFDQTDPDCVNCQGCPKCRSE
jgi:hypothetical protein